VALVKEAVGAGPPMARVAHELTAIGVAPTEVYGLIAGAAAESGRPWRLLVVRRQPSAVRGRSGGDQGAARWTKSGYRV